MSRQITLAELKTMAQAVAGQISKVYLHWTAGHYGQQFPDYHILVDKDGSIYATTDDIAAVLAHTYKRNTGAIGVGAMCMVDATTEDFGPEPLTALQIEAIAQLMAVLAETLNLPIIIQNFMTHAEAANNLDGYDPGYTDPTGHPGNIYGPNPNPDGSEGGDCERWDLWILAPGDKPWSGGDTLRGKAIWYQQKGVA